METHEQTECELRSVEICADANDDFMSEQCEFSDKTNTSDAKNVPNTNRSSKSRLSGSKPKRVALADKKFECIYCPQKYAMIKSLNRHIIDHGIIYFLILEPLTLLNLAKNRFNQVQMEAFCTDASSVLIISKPQKTETLIR